MIWYPYAQMKTMPQPYKIVDAKGVYLYTEDNKMIDSISSWWCMIHGYKHPVLNEALKTQIAEWDIDAIDENQDETINEILKIVTDWLVNHILHEDKLIGQA